MKKNRTGICTFYRNTDEDAGEHCREAATQGLWRGFWYRSYCTKRYFRGSLYLLQCQGNLLDCTADRKTDTYTVVKAKDYIRKPKKNGYESYHIVLDIPMSYKGKTTVVRVELQLRTMIMDAWAGMDNRVSYKKEFRRKWNAALKICQDRKKTW